jgi:hypothetical protein
MVRYCEEEKCKEEAYWKYKDDTYGRFCKEHKKDDMKSIDKRVCEGLNCDKQPSFNNKGEKKGRFCYEHKKEGMVDVVSKKCEFDGCDKHPSFNNKGEKKGRFCYDHKKEGMIDIKSKKCEFDGCDKRPSFNNKGEKKGRFCYDHKKEGMVDVKHKTCKTYLCDTRATNKYKGYCLRCFIYTFPEQSVTRNYKTKEKAVVDRVKEKYPTLDWICDKVVPDGCSRRRPDMFLDMGSYIIIVEIDENQHEMYDSSCENKRLMQIWEDVGCRPMIFIRFNPDGYKDKEGKNITSCWSTNKQGILVIKKVKEWDNRINKLLEEIEYWSNNEPEDIRTIRQLFYDLN